MTANIFNPWLKISKITTEPMLEYCALFTDCFSKMAKHNLQAGSDLMKAHSDQLGALAQTKSPEEFCKRQTEYVLSQLPKTFDHTEKVLGIMQETVKNTGELMQKCATQYCKDAQSSQK